MVFQKCPVFLQLLATVLGSVASRSINSRKAAIARNITSVFTQRVFCIVPGKLHYTCESQSMGKGQDPKMWCFTGHHWCQLCPT